MKHKTYLQEYYIPDLEERIERIRQEIAHEG
jgi:hypothetical protein